MNRSTRTLAATLLPPVLMFVFVFFILRIDIYSTVLLTAVTLLFAAIAARARRKNDPGLPGNLSAELEAELQALMKQAQTDMDQIQYVARHVKSREVADNAMALHRLGEKIMEYLRRNPHKITKARRFFGYYLDTARDILTKYHEFEITGIQAREVDNIETKTTSALLTLQDAFKKQYVQLATNELMDIEADIDLLEKTNPRDKNQIKAD